jgi:hypothetical protein
MGKSQSRLRGEVRSAWRGTARRQRPVCSSEVADLVERRELSFLAAQGNSDRRGG